MRLQTTPTFRWRDRWAARGVQLILLAALLVRPLWGKRDVIAVQAQPTDAGIVREILVSEGEAVREGRC